MPRIRRSGLLVLCGLTLLAGCDSFDKDGAALAIRDRFCEGWPYGCTDSTQVFVEKVNKTRNGRQVLFRVRDRADETARLSAAYFEPRGDGWIFLLFEKPFNDRFQAEAGRVGQHSRAFTDHLMELKSAQRWFLSIYSRYARTLAELDSVSYKPPDLPIEMTLSGGDWRAVMRSQYVRCEFDSGRMQLPSCSGLSALNAGVGDGPLFTAFGAAE
ncbi:MAG: hypothetical protein JSV86_13005 [Gemmatimonadota bacterium]|nr:MAG: hypothetical protein JSV86_13005 [Gemmatimonadota bacterium]